MPFSSPSGCHFGCLLHRSGFAFSFLCYRRVPVFAAHIFFSTVSLTRIFSWLLLPDVYRLFAFALRCHQHRTARGRAPDIAPNSLVRLVPFADPGSHAFSHFLFCTLHSCAFCAVAAVSALPGSPFPPDISSAVSPRVPVCVLCQRLVSFLPRLRTRQRRAVPLLPRVLRHRFHSFGSFRARLLLRSPLRSCRSPLLNSAFAAHHRYASAGFAHSSVCVWVTSPAPEWTTFRCQVCLVRTRPSGFNAAVFFAHAASCAQQPLTPSSVWVRAPHKAERLLISLITPMLALCPAPPPHTPPPHLRGLCAAFIARRATTLMRLPPTPPVCLVPWTRITLSFRSSRLPFSLAFCTPLFLFVVWFPGFAVCALGVLLCLRFDTADAIILRSLPIARSPRCVIFAAFKPPRFIAHPVHSRRRSLFARVCVSGSRFLTPFSSRILVARRFLVGTYHTCFSRRHSGRRRCERLVLPSAVFTSAAAQPPQHTTSCGHSRTPRAHTHRPVPFYRVCTGLYAFGLYLANVWARVHGAPLTTYNLFCCVYVARWFARCCLHSRFTR